MRRELAVVLLVVVAGCSGLNGGTPSTKTTDKATPVQTTTAAPSNGTQAGATPSNTVDYAALTDTEKRAFDAARRGEVGFAPESVRESPYVDRTYFPTSTRTVFQNHEYVQKNGSYYRLSWDVGPTIATYGIQATEQRPPENATVVALENLSMGVREPVRNAVQNGSYDTPFGKWDSLPASLDGAEYVRDNDTYYKIDVVAGDFWGDQMSAQRVDS